MLANARVLGHVFDPLSVFWCSPPTAAPVCIVAEVHNTYGERHAYLLRPDAAGAAVRTRRSTSRRSSTSPAATSCGSRCAPDRVATTVMLRRDGAVAFTATFRGRPVPATRHGAARRLVRQPLMTAAGLGPDPGARQLAVAAPPARPPPSAPHPQEGV